MKKLKKLKILDFKKEIGIENATRNWQPSAIDQKDRLSYKKDTKV